jgi:hypothetical protein
MKAFALSTGSQYVAVAATSAKFAAAMDPNKVYRLTVTVDTWVHIGLTGDSAAAATADNMLVLAGQSVFLAHPYQPAGGRSSASASAGFVHCIRASADGDATLTQVVEVDG